jgi:hypothetical protein
MKIDVVEFYCNLSACVNFCNNLATITDMKAYRFWALKWLDVESSASSVNTLGNPPWLRRNSARQAPGKQLTQRQLIIDTFNDTGANWKCQMSNSGNAPVLLKIYTS